MEVSFSLRGFVALRLCPRDFTFLKPSSSVSLEELMSITMLFVFSPEGPVGGFMSEGPVGGLIPEGPDVSLIFVGFSLVFLFVFLS